VRKELKGVWELMGGKPQVSQQAGKAHGKVPQKDALLDVCPYLLKKA
jgi:hypothetical protein